MISPLVVRLEQIAEEYPDSIAVDHNSKQVSYSELWSMVRIFANEFLEQANTPKVVILTAPGAQAYAAMFGAMMAGGFYVPLNFEGAVERLASAIAQIDPDIVLCDLDTVKIARSIKGTFKLSEANALLDAGSPLKNARPAHRLAYVIFTSGSTGEPKGVMISQPALDHYARWAGSAMQVSRDDRWSQHPNLGFDLSVLDIYGALTNGATLCPLTTPVDRMLPARAVKRLQLTIWNSVPSVAGLIISSGEWKEQNMASLRLATFCGEPLLPQHLEGIFAGTPDIKVHNTYGPTEATVSCTLLELDKDNYTRFCQGTVAIGEAIPGMELQIIGQDGKPASQGELLIFGKQLADGYWGLVEMTNDKFPQHGTGDAGRTCYMTGDRGEQTSTGIYFRERLDDQVKIKGYRIELGEINALVRSLGYTNAATICDKEKLICFVEGYGTDQQLDDIRASARIRLENYMQPAEVFFLPELPRNANDKISLPDLVKYWKQLKTSVRTGEDT